MSNPRINQIDKEIARLQTEKENLEAIERLPEVQKKVKDYLDRTYSGNRLLENHSLNEKGLWKVRGEDPNCDLGGYHHQPDLGVVDGTLQEALEYGVMHKDFYHWGAGGDFEKLDIIKPK